MADVLLLSAGRRVALLRLFVEAARRYGLTVTAADMNPLMSSACQDHGDYVQLPHVLAEDYAGRLEDYCREQRVRLVVPTIDTELPVLSRLKPKFAEFGCVIAVSDEALVRQCRDKRLTASMFASLGLRSPEIMNPADLSYPLIVKPYDGSLSVGISVVRSPSELQPSHLANDKNIFCQYLEPAAHDEFTCDAYFDRGSHLLCVVPRKRLEVRGGEVSKGRTERNGTAALLAQRLSHLPGAVGCLTIQMMVNRDTGDNWLIEVNPRFGGGYPLTARSGAEYHDWLIREYILHHQPDRFDAWEDGLLMLRYDDAVFLS